MMTECPCGSGLDYEQCCGPLHRQQRWADSAETLMRSRYSAYVLQLEEYLLYSWHPSTRPTPPFDWSAHWCGLQIVSQQQGGAADTTGEVEFVARFERDGQPASLHERSRFCRYEGRWVYLDGVQNPEKTGVGRNAPCPCGSGFKYKRCCGK